MAGQVEEPELTANEDQVACSSEEEEVAAKDRGGADPVEEELAVGEGPDVAGPDATNRMRGKPPPGAILRFGIAIARVARLSPMSR